MPIRRKALLGAIFNPSGGLRYHIRAFVGAKTRWLNFRSDIEKWLDGWQPACEHLVLVGPSGGYCLTRGLLTRFSRITVWDPDPIARVVFKTRYRDIPASKKRAVIWHLDDFFDRLLEVDFNPDEFSKKFLGGGTFAVCFANILGQLHLIHDGELISHKTLLAGLKRFLKDTPWASFHDRLSGAMTPIARGPVKNAKRLEGRELSRLFYGVERAGELWEHDLDVLLEDMDGFAYWTWPITKKQHHVIEGVYRS